MKRTFLSVTIACVLAILTVGCSDNKSVPLPASSSPTTTLDSSTAPTSRTTSVPPSSVAPPVDQSNEPPESPAPAGCFDPSRYSDDWNTYPKTRGNGLVQGELFAVRTGRHECYDRIVFDIHTNAYLGFRIGYVPVVTQDGSGHEMPVAGTAALQLAIDAPAATTLMGYDFTSQWNALREVKFAGSFEAVSTFAIGVAGKRPFAATHWQEGDVIHVVVDIYNQ